MACCLKLRPERYRFRCYMPDKGIEVILMEPDFITTPCWLILVYIDGCDTPLRVEEAYDMDSSRAEDKFLSIVAEFRQR